MARVMRGSPPDGGVSGHVAVNHVIMTGKVVAVVPFLQPSLCQQYFQRFRHFRGIHAAVGNGAYLQLMQVIQQGGFCQIVMQGELAEDGGERERDRCAIPVSALSAREGVFLCPVMVSPW